MSHISHESAMNLCHLLRSACLHNCQLLYSCSSCLFQCHCQCNCYPLHNRCARSGWPSWQSFISIFQAHLGASCLSWLPEASWYEILPMVHMRPMAIALHYSVKKHMEWCTPDIYENFQFNSPVWGELTVVSSRENALQFVFNGSKRL